MNLLLIEDEIKMAHSLKVGLEEQGYRVDLAHSGTEGLQKAMDNNYGVIVSDIMLPGISGIEVCKQLRLKSSEPPVLLLTALGTTDDKVLGFDVGADDYLVKPFEFRELTARLKAILKRSNTNNPTDNTVVSTPLNVIRVADLALYPDSQVVERAGKIIDLTAREFDLIVYFIENKNKVISKKEIAENVWDIHFDTGTNIIEVYVNYVRKKIDKNFDEKLIHTIHGRGYMLKDESAIAM